MTVPMSVHDALAWWTTVYSDQRLVAVSVRFVHIAALVIGGGTAIAADRMVLRAARGNAAAREAAIAVVRRAHRTVTPALVLVAASGVLMTAADTDTFLHSPIYWTKLALVALLVANGGGLVLAGRMLGRPSGWRRLAVGSAASLVLWIVLLFVGTLLTAAA